MAAPSTIPRTRDLALHQRLGVHATASADIALRTAAATVVSTTLRRHACDLDAVRRDADRLGLYRELATADDPDEVFPAPDPDILVQEVSQTGLPRRWDTGQLRVLSFDSPFTPLHPDMREPYLARPRNGTAWAQHWTHADGPRPTIIVVHGFMASPYWVNRAFLSLPWFYGHGYDILLATLPFHGRRRDSWRRYSGAGLFDGGVSHLNEAMAHGLHDLRAWVDHLVRRGVPRIGVTGISLGGYMTSLLASVDDRLSFAIPNVPVVDIADLMGSWNPAGWMVRGALRRVGEQPDQLRASLAVHSPLSWQPRLAHHRRFVIAGLGDRLAPPSHARALWEHWDRPQAHWFPGNHVLHVDQGSYLRNMGRFLQAIEFAG